MQHQQVLALRHQLAMAHRAPAQTVASQPVMHPLVADARVTQPAPNANANPAPMRTANYSYGWGTY